MNWFILTSLCKQVNRRLGGSFFSLSIIVLSIYQRTGVFFYLLRDSGHILLKECPWDFGWDFGWDFDGYLMGH